MKLKNIFSIFVVAILFIVSCEFDDGRPEIKQGTTKAITIESDALIPLEDPSAFNSQLTLDVISEAAVGSVDIQVIFGRAEYGTVDTAFFKTQTTFPETHTLSLQTFADLFPDSSDVILNNLAGEDFFRFITGDIHMADGSIIPNGNYEFQVSDTTDTGADTLVTLAPNTYSSGVQSIHNSVWPQEYTYFVVCNIDASFTGDYLLEYVSGATTTVFGIPIFIDGEIVKITQNSYTGRKLSFSYLGGMFGLVDLDFQLSCGSVNALFSESGIGCGGPGLNLGISSGTPQTYDPADDSVFMLSFSENIDSGCGGAPQEVLFRLTKQ